MEHVIATILENVKKRGNDFAISDENSSFTYSELLEYAKIIAANLTKNNVKYGDRVIVEISRRKEYVGALLGCWIMGAVTIPLTDDYPEERLNYIKKDSKYNFLIDENFIKKLDKSKTIEPIIPEIEDDGLVIYTSGSTGNPKGVIHSFLSMTAVATRNTVHDQAEETEKNEIFGLIAPFTFIVGMSLLLGGFALCKHIYIVPDEIRKDPFKLAKYYDDNDIQSSFVPPRMVNFMLEHNKSLKVISVGSERIVNLYFNDKPVVMNGYGSTETFGGCLCFKIDKAYENTPIGLPFGKEKAYVLDDNNNEVEQGELCIAGHIASGYLNLEEESKKVFVENPFKEIDGFPRMFRTRDIVKKLPDGNLVFVERKDWMIKINGQRVEPLEIESTIRRLKGIDNVAIKDFTSKNGVTYLVAYYVSKSNLSEDVIREHCKANLTSYMVPTFYIKIDELPVNANGKLDRKNLPEPDIKSYKREYIAPQNKVEESLCNAIEEVLNCGKVGRNDDFFLLGGDSIKALEVINKLEDLPLDIEMFFDGKCAKNIADSVLNGGRDEIEFDRVNKDFYPLTSSQLGVYFPSISEPENLQYNNPIKINIEKCVNISKLIDAIKQTINNHKAYKCNIKLVNGQPSMVPNDNEFKVDLIKTNDVDFEIKKFVRPFVLDNDKLVRISIIETDTNYVLLFDAHHIVFDGTTLAILLKEISNIYEGKSIYEERTSLFDMSTYEEVLQQSEKYNEAKLYNEKLFDELEIENDFPLDFNDEHVASLGNITKEFEIEKSVLDKFLKSNGITENSLFLSAYSYVLSKFNGSGKALVCCAESGRHTSMTFNTAGMLVKTIALPIDLENKTDISDFIRDVQTLFKNGTKYDSYPFSELANKYNLNNDFMFVFQGKEFSYLKLENKEFKVEGLPNPNSISKISLMGFGGEGKYRFSFSYRSDLFLREIIESFADTFIKVIKEFIVKESVKEINLVPENQIAILDSFNNNKMELENKTVIDFFNEQVKLHGDKDLLIFKDKKFTYKEVDLISNKIANYIHNLGIKNNDVVSILTNRNEWMLIATFGVLKSGAAYEPLDSSYPSERLSFMVKDSNAKLLITTKELESLIRDYNGKVLYIEDIEDLNDEKPINVQINMDDLLVMLYTSGTTGTPKGVMLCHRNLSSFIQQDIELFNLNENSIIANYASFGFDAGLRDLMNVASSGGVLHIIDEDIRLDLPTLDNYFIENKINGAFMTTQVARQFILMTKSPYLNFVLYGGEKIVPYDTSNLKFDTYNGYGPTECTVFLTIKKVDKNYYRVPIGKNNKNISCYIVDKNFNRLPIGVPGELLASGPQIGKGYLHLEEKTNKVFIKNPFSQEEFYKIAYRTGDIVRYLGNGELDFIGRNDGQVKIRGFRIELSEVEKIIREFDGIKDATVTAFDYPAGGKYLAAYIVSDEKISIENLKKFISSKKPTYMVPEAIAQIDKIPLNQNHKVNKRALPLIAKSKEKKITTDRKENLIVKKIRSIVKAVLNDDSFDYEDNLLEYGMNSLSIVRLSVLLNEEFNVTCDVKELLTNCSINSIENLVINFLLNNSNTKKEEHILQDKYLLNASQTGIYTEYLKDVNSIKYNIPIVVNFPKNKYQNISVSKIKEALLKVVEAHQSLKSTIESDANGKFVIVPHFGEKVNIEEFKMSEKDYEKFTHSYVKPHNLAKNVYRFAVVEHEETISLLLDIHHVMFDGYSQNVFLNDLVSALKNETINKEEYSIFDFSIDEESLRNSEKYKDAKEYYSNLLSVVDGSTSIEQDLFENEKVAKSLNIISSDLSVSKVKEFCKNKNITLNAFFLSAFALTLSRFTYQNDVCFTTVYNGRNSVKQSHMVGMTVKTLPFVASFDGDIKVNDFLKNNKKQILDSMNNDVYSFAELSRELDITLNIMFVYQGETNGVNGLDVNFLALNDLKSNIVVEVRNDDDKFYIHSDFDNGKYSEKLISRFLNSFINVCKGLVEKESLNEISLINSNDLKELDVLNNNKMDYDRRPPVIQFMDVAKKYPDKDCVIFNGKHLTYKEVDELTNKVGSKISSFGLGRNDIVGVLINRSEMMLVCTYGVLKSGAAYQPLDTTYPSERINFMLKDSGAKLLITTKELRNIASEYNGEVLYIEDFDALPKPKEKLEIDTKGNDLLILLYTSGTTGLPKGVMIENHNLSDFIAIDSKARDVDENTISACYGSYGFDSSLMDLFTVPSHGGTVHILDEDIRLDLHRLEKYFIDNKITHLIATTQMGRQIALFTKNEHFKNVCFGGEKIVPFERKDAHFSIFNCYGPTECTVYTNYHSMKGSYYRVPIGRQHSNLKIYILDKNNNCLPSGAIGELGISGHQVSRGYLNRPEKTLSTFIKNKFDNDPEYETIYKTGDVVRMLENGEIDIIGRNDSQVKIRGFRIELTEVEEVIRRFNGIKDATVAAFDEPTGGKYIAAYIVADNKIDIKDLNAFIMSQKPPYMVPKITMQIDAIPLNVNGKVDKKKLPAPDLSLLQDDYVAPVNNLEKEFCDLFGKILGISKVGATDDFFMLGGSSINAAQIVSYAFSKGYDLVYKNVFENTTPRELANFISNASNIEVEEVIQNDFKETIEPAFANNNSSKLGELKTEDIGNVLLFGSTGFLGSHVLKELLDTTNHEIICAVRQSELQDPKSRLMTLLNYYFEDTFEYEFGKRIHVINSDLLDETIADKVKDFDFKTIINCAAVVKHFASDNSIEKTNTGGVVNLISLAKKLNKRLVHVSTLSVSGESINENIPKDFRFKETMLDVGQVVDNKYTRSKLDAEIAIRDAIVNDGLSAKIIRVGNLMSRNSDGEFQINAHTNNFMNTIKAFKMIGCVPYDMLNHNVEFSQIDLVSKAVVLLSSTNDMFNVYHVNNVHSIQMNNVINELNSNGFEIKKVSNEEFGNTLNAILNTEKEIGSINSLLAYRANRNEHRRMIQTDNTFTLDTLYRLGFYWPLPDSEYLSKLIEYLVSLDFLK